VRMDPSTRATTTAVKPAEPVGELSSEGSALRADLALLSVALIWGINIPLSKYALGFLDPFAFNALRLTLSALVLGWLDHRERRGTKAAAVPWVRVVLVGLLYCFAYQILFILGMANTTAGNTGLLIASSPLWTAVIAALTRLERLRPGAWLGLVLAILGTALVTLGPALGDADLAAAGISFSSGHLVGNLLVLVAAMTWAWSTVLSKPMLRDLSPTRLAYLFTAVTLPLHFLVAIPSAAATVRFEAPAGVWGVVAYAGLLSTGVAYAFYNFGVRKVGASHTAIYTNLVPLVALLLSWLALHETIPAAQPGGGALLPGGLVVMRRSR